jgi:CRP/FNR family transcriptional regulator, cyclic AMP receptor protein
MTPDILAAARDYPEIAFAPGDVLIREGTISPPIFVLLSGTVSVYRGDIRVSRTSLEGALFGEMSILLDIPSTATVIADTPVRAARIDDSGAFLSERPQVALHSAKLLAQRLYDATTYLADLKRQFMDEESHLGMVDRILGSLLTQQLERPVKPDEDRADPRL